MAKKTNRTRLISLIHAQKNSAALDDETYRLIIAGATGKQSCTDCSMQELKTVFADLNAVLLKQGNQTFSFYPKWENPSLLDAVAARAKNTLGTEWKNRLNSFVQNKFKKDTYTKCSSNELRSVMAFLTKVERREREAK